MADPQKKAPSYWPCDDCPLIDNDGSCIQEGGCEDAKPKAPCRCGEPTRPRWRHAEEACLSEDVDTFLDDALGPKQKDPWPCDRTWCEKPAVNVCFLQPDDLFRACEEHTEGLTQTVEEYRRGNT